MCTDYVPALFMYKNVGGGLIVASEKSVLGRGYEPCPTLHLILLFAATSGPLLPTPLQYWK